MLKKFFCFYYSFFSFILLFSCASVQRSWYTDVSNMKKEVQTAKKDAFILFTGSDWDEASKKLLAKLFSSTSENELFSKYGKQFLFYHVDIVRNEDAMDTKQLKRNYLLFSKYNVGDLPYIVVRNFEGDVYYSALLSNGENIRDVLESTMKAVVRQATYIEGLKRQIKSSSGFEKTRAIDAFFSSIYNADYAIYDDLRMQAIEADPKNESGLLGRFKMIVTSLKSEKLVMQKQYLRAADEYILILKEDCLDAQERQNAWYQIAYLYALSKKIENEKIIYCLKNAINASPQSEAVPRLQEIIDRVKK